MVNPLDAFTGRYQQEAAAQKEAGLRAGMTDYGRYADLGRGALGTNYAQAAQQYANLQPGSTAAYNAYLDATGANGAEGLQRANAQYLQASPGFAGAAEMAAKLAARGGVAGGQAGGNTLAEIGKRTTQMGLEAFDKYRQGLSYAPGLATNLAGGAAGVYTGLGQGLAGSYTDQAKAFLGANKDIGAAQAEGTMGNLTGLNNLWNFGLNAATAAAGGGMGGGLGALAKGAGSGLFGGLTNNFLSSGSFNRG